MSSIAKTNQPCLVIVMTVPETFLSILRTQPQFLSSYYRVVLVTSDKEGCKVLEQEEGVEVFCVNMVRGISPIRDCIAIMKLGLLLMRLRPNIVHSYTPKAGLVTMIASWLSFVPIRIHTFTGLIFPSRTGLKRQLLICIDSLVSRLATHVVPEGQGVRNDLIRFGICKRPCTVIGNGNIAGVDTSYFSRNAPGVECESTRLRAEYKINIDDVVFCFVGRLNRDKGLRELAFAMEGLTEPNTRLLIIGSFDRTAPIEESVMASLQRDSRITFCGYQKDIRPFLSRSSALVLPSYREGFPNVLLQASSMELPMIASDINGSNEVVEPGLTGWLVPAKDADQLRCAMELACKCEPEVFRQMGRAARAKIIEKFERNYYLDQLLEFYRERLAERSK